MKLLFIHQNFPGQYLHLAPAMARAGHEVVGLGETHNIESTRPTPGVRRVGYKVQQPDAAHRPHQYLRNFDTQVRRGQRVARAIMDLDKRGFRPDMICVHPGWGEGLYLKDVLPDVPVLGLYEYYYRGRGQDVGFDPEFPADLNAQARIRTWNANNLIALEALDAGVCPTEFQKSVHPRRYHDKLAVIHEGIDTDQAVPDDDATLTIKQSGQDVSLSGDDEVVTFVNRNLEPYRGYHTFMRALPRILERDGVQVVIVGGSSKGYGGAPKTGTWKRQFLEEVRDEVDLSRIHFVNRVPYDKLLKLFQLSSAHVYLTYPFVLSWSLLDAMSCGCAVVGSATAPVEEVIDDGVNGLLVDFFEPETLADRVLALLEDPALRSRLGRTARESVLARYRLDDCLTRQVALIERVREGC